MSFAIGVLVGSMIRACLGLLVAAPLRVAAKGDVTREVRPSGAAGSDLLS